MLSILASMHALVAGEPEEEGFTHEAKLLFVVVFFCSKTTHPIMTNSMGGGTPGDLSHSSSGSWYVTSGVRANPTNYP